MAKVTLGENRYMDMLANDGVEFARAISSITIWLGWAGAS